MVAAAIGVSAVIGGVTALRAGRSQSRAAGQAAALQAGATSEAAALQLQATQEAIREQRRQFNLARRDLAPYRETGVPALAQYAALYGITRDRGRRRFGRAGQDAGLLSREEMQAARDRFMETPGYQFRFDEGIRALDRSASARGNLLSGGYGRELTRYGQGIASEEFTNYANRLASLAGMGQGATTATATLGAQTAGNIGNALMSGAQGRANTLMAGARGQGSAIMAAGTARASGYAGLANAFSGGVQNYLTARWAGVL